MHDDSSIHDFHHHIRYVASDNAFPCLMHPSSLILCKDFIDQYICIIKQCSDSAAVFAAGQQHHALQLLCSTTAE